MLNLQAVNHFTATSIRCGISLYYAREVHWRTGTRGMGKTTTVNCIAGLPVAIRPDDLA